MENLWCCNENTIVTESNYYPIIRACQAASGGFDIDARFESGPTRSQALCPFLSPLTPQPMNREIQYQTSVRQTGNTVKATLANGVELTFTLENGMLAGLTQAIVDGLPLIAPGSPRLPHVETRDQWTVSGYRFLSAHAEGDTVVLEAEVFGTKPPLGHKLDAYTFAFITTPHRVPKVMGTFRWIVRPETVAIGDPAVRVSDYLGFSYQFAFDLNREFHWVLDSGTWEVGGDPEGITLLSQHMNPIAGLPEAVISRKGRSYSSAESFLPKSTNYSTTVPDIPTDPSLGLILPIQAQLRGAGGAVVDVQFKGEDLAICYYNQADYYRTVIEWRTNDPGIGHLDHHYFPLTKSYTTPAKTILAARVPGMTRIDALNRWTDAWEHVAASWRKQAGVSRVEPQVDFALDCCGSAGRHLGYASADILERWEKRFDWLVEQGFTSFWLGGLGNHRGHELPMVANMCQPYDYTVIERYGGPERFREFCERAHARGIKVGIWLGGHISDTAPIVKEHPEWSVADNCGKLWSGGYREIHALSLRSGFRDWLFNQFQDLKSLGLDFIFIDSYHNLAAMPINNRDPLLAPQIKDLWALQADFARIGLETIVETVSVIGLTATGLWKQYLESPELNYWSKLGCSVDDRQSHSFRKGLLTAELYFRMLANKAPVGFGVLEQDNAPYEGLPWLPDEIKAMNRAYNMLAPDMQVRTLQHDGSIVWNNPATNRGALFAVGTGSVTVPAGFHAEPVYGTDAPLASGMHPINNCAAFKLIEPEIGVF